MRKKENKKARGVYIGGAELSCGNDPSYFADLAAASNTLMQHLRTGSETNTATVHMNYCKPSENLFGIQNASKDYYVTGSIVSTQKISDGYIVGYHAGSYIELNPDFVSGNNFLAEINPCVITRTIIAAKRDDIDEEIQQSPSNSLVEGITIKIYPTVVESENAIKIEADRNIQNVSVTLFDIQGKVVLQSNVREINANEPHSFMLSSLPSGFYFVKTQNSTFSFTQKIIVR